MYILTYIVALVLGGLLASLGTNVNALRFLSYAVDWGFSPFTLDLKVISLTLGLRINISVAQIIMIIVAIFTAPKIVSRLADGE